MAFLDERPVASLPTSDRTSVLITAARSGTGAYVTLRSMRRAPSGQGVITGKQYLVLPAETMASFVAALEQAARLALAERPLWSVDLEALTREG